MRALPRPAPPALTFSGALLSGACNCPAAATAGATSTGARADYPLADSLDAVRAVPRNHRVVLTNDSVRVLDVTVAPGERQPLHAQVWRVAAAP